MADVDFVNEHNDTHTRARGIVDELAEELGYDTVDYLYAFATEEGREDMRQRIKAL